MGNKGKGKKRRASTSATDLAQMTQEDEDDELMVLNDDDNNVMEMMEAQDAGKAKGPTKFLKQQDDDEEEDAEESEVEDDNDEEETEQKPAEASKENKELLQTVLNDLREKGQQPWIERLDVTAGRPIVVDNPDDDLRREVQFYNQALASVKAARTALDNLGAKHMRPDDYFAEMLKSDKHMAKVKDKLIVEKQRMQAFEQRKKAQESKKYAKQVASERFQEKSLRKKADIEAIQQWQKKKASRGGITDENADKELESMLSASKAAKTKPKPNKKRQGKDKKYGFGGPKRPEKKNDSKSASDTREFSMKRNRTLPDGLNRAMKSGAGKNRPGKARRQAKRGR